MVRKVGVESGKKEKYGLQKVIPPNRPLGRSIPKIKGGDHTARETPKGFFAKKFCPRVGQEKRCSLHGRTNKREKQVYP